MRGILRQSERVSGGDLGDIGYMNPMRTNALGLSILF